MADVSLDRVSKRYGRTVWGVRCATLSVREGELMVLVGPSGSGKSTVLRVIAGLEDATEGEVRIGGARMNDIPANKRGVAMVFQNSTLYPHMTVERNLRFGMGRGGGRGRVGGSTAPVEEADWVRSAAASLRIDHLLGRYPGELSGGERQRAALAKAMVRRPRVFLFDEPLSSLDVQLRHEARGEIKAVHRRLGTTMIHVTHDQEEAMVLGDRITVMREGRVQQVGMPAEVYRRPANAFVAGFVGSPGMNFLSGVVRRGMQEGMKARKEGNAGPFEGAIFEGIGGTMRLPIRGEAGRRLAERAGDGQRVLMGVRPQGIRLGAAQEGEWGFNLEVEMVQPLGDAADLVGRGPGSVRMVVRTGIEALALTPGTALACAAGLEQLYFFEETGEQANLLLERPQD